MYSLWPWPLVSCLWRCRLAPWMARRLQIGSFYTSKFYEVQKYLTLANRIYHTMTFLMSDAAWQGLTEAQQQILLEAVNESKMAHKDYMTTYNEDALQDMIENHGLVVSELSEGEFEKMREMSQPVYDLVESYDPERYAALMEAAKLPIPSFPPSKLNTVQVRGYSPHLGSSPKEVS